MTGLNWLFVLAIVGGSTILLVWLKRRTGQTVARLDEPSQREFEVRSTRLSAIGSLVMGGAFVTAMLVSWPRVTSMRYIFLTIVMVLLPSAHFISVNAQDPPPPAKDYFPSTWDEYCFPAGQFCIRLPQKPTESKSTQGRFEVNSIEYKGLITYRVSYVDYQVPIDDPQKVKEMLQGLKTTALDSIRDKGVRIVADREVTVGSHTGIYLHLEVGGKEIVRIEWIPAGTRLYTISTTSRKGIPQELEGKDDYEKVATGFIGSFRVTP